MLVHLTDRGDIALGVINVDIVNRALVDTDAMIDGYLAARYTLPVSSTPSLIADLAQAIAIYKLHTSSPDPKIKDDFDQAIRTLKDISTGAVRLSIAGIEPATTSEGTARMTDRERPLTAKNMKGLI